MYRSIIIMTYGIPHFTLSKQELSLFDDAVSD